MIVRGVEVPPFLYGTAWKEQRTADLVTEAIAAGFRGIDTANQRKHYHEAGVGAALTAVLESGAVRRNELFVQTKFTHAGGQDHRLPYDDRADYATQVRQSFETSLQHLGLQRIDSYVLHGPLTRRGLSEGDAQVWRTMENLQHEGLAGLIGISNVSTEQLSTLLSFADVPPAFVQNRCYAQVGWDRETRAVCRANDVIYQGFSLLTANVRELQRPEVHAIATRHGKTLPQVAFRFAIQAGMLPLTGTTDPQHMRQDLDVFDFALSEDEVATIESIGE